MTDEQPGQAPAAPAAPAPTTPAVSVAPVMEMASTPGGLLTLAAGLMLVGWFVFDVLLDLDLDPWGALVAAALVLWARWRPSGLAEPLTRPIGMAVLAAVMFLFGVFSLVFDIREAYFPNVEVAIGLLVFWASAAMAGLAWQRLGR